LGVLPNTLRFIHAAERLGVPWSGVTREIFQFGHGARARRLHSSFTDHTNTLAVQVAKQKPVASRLLRSMGVPVPRQRSVRTLDECQAAAGQLGFPLVVKPASRDQGMGVVTNITSLAELESAFTDARRLGATVLVEKHVDGDDHRLLVVDGRMLVATRRMPGGVTGDGRRTVVELVERVNADPVRVNDKRGLIRLVVDEEALALLSKQGLSQWDVPDAGRFVRLRYTANISTGGVPEDVTAKVHPDNRFLAERAARIIGLDIAGVDLLIADIGQSWREIGGAICEVNAQPGLRVHWTSGLAWDLNERILAGLLGEDKGRIPIAAVTGTNGKTTVCQMVHAIWRMAGKVSGLTTTQGVWIGDELVSQDNLSGFPGGRLVLADPTVEAAVIEMPRKGIIKFGFPFDQCSVAALLNVQDDHLGLDGIGSLDEMARLKSEVLARANDAVVVNAEDARCVEALGQATAPRRILFARNGESPALVSHRMAGGEAVFLDEREGVRWVVVAEGARGAPLMPAGDIPATMNGRLPFNESNALCAVALAWAQGVPFDVIRKALEAFSNTLEQNPGRYNFFPGLPYQVLLDYAHNPSGVAGLCAVARELPVSGKRRLVCVNLGNRGEAHIRTCVPVLKDHFDDFILSQDLSRVLQCRDYAGDDPSGTMLRFFEQQMRAVGVPADCVAVERDPARAIRLGLGRAQPGDLLVLMADHEMVAPIMNAVRGVPGASGHPSPHGTRGTSGPCAG
jgi:cyanophycin synthetase